MPTTFLGTKEYVNAAVNKIELMKGRDLPEETGRYLIEFFDKIGQYKTSAIVSQLKGYDTIPQNIIGCVEKMAAEINYNSEIDKYKMKDRDDLGDPLSAGLFAEFMQEIFVWHKSGLVETNKDNPCDIMDIEQWATVNRPKTWSPIIDDWMKGYEAAYYLERQQKGAIANFLKSYNEKLKIEREKRGINDQIRTNCAS
jgi:hypothetical protein